MRMSARAAFKEKISFIKILAGNKVRDRFFDEWNMRRRKRSLLEKELNIVYTIIAENISEKTYLETCNRLFITNVPVLYYRKVL